MKPLAYINFVVFSCYFWCFVFILMRNPKALLNRVCALLLVTFMIWTCSYAFRDASRSFEGALFWERVSSIGWCGFPAVALWFALIITNKKRMLESRLFYVLIFVVPGVLIYEQWNGKIVSGMKEMTFGWMEVWAGSVWTYCYYAYLGFCLIAIVYLCFELWKMKSPYAKVQATIILAAAIVTMISGITMDIILPLAGYSGPVFANILVLIWVICFIYVVTNYQLIPVTLELASSRIVGTMPDMLVLFLPDLSVVDTNEAFTRITGYSREEIKGKPLSMLVGEISPVSEKTDVSRFVKGTVRNLRMDLVTKQGEAIPISFSSSRLLDGNKNVIGIVGIGRDISEIVRMQEHEAELLVASERARAKVLEESGLKLARIVSERTRELERINLAGINIMEDLGMRRREIEKAYLDIKEMQSRLIQSDKMAAVGQLAGGIANEINAPIDEIIGLVRGLAKTIDGGDPLAYPLKSIEREAIRCKKLVVNLLLFSRTEREAASRVNIHDTIDDALVLVNVRAKDAGIEIVKKYGKNIPPVPASGSQIQQVVVNLCNNAIDAMESSGTITIVTRKKKNAVLVSVKDTGSGMDENVKSHLFEPFFTTKNVGKGTGLGLSICYEIIKNHNGTVEVSSEIGKGTSITLTLPA
jgi:PAS domain S-box-containing protein